MKTIENTTTGTTTTTTYDEQRGDDGVRVSDEGAADHHGVDQRVHPNLAEQIADEEQKYRKKQTKTNTRGDLNQQLMEREDVCAVGRQR